MSVAAGVALAGGNAVRLGAAAPDAEVLTGQELAVVRALTEAMFPQGPFPLGGLEAGVPEKVDHIVGWMMDDTRAAGFRYALRALEWGTLASRGVRFSELSVDDRVDVLEAWADPSVMPRRIALDSFKAVFGMAFFGNPQVQEHMGWRASCGGGHA